jgi:hypothetical protein
LNFLATTFQSSLAIRRHRFADCTVHFHIKIAPSSTLTTSNIASCQSEAFSTIRAYQRVKYRQCTHREQIGSDLPACRKDCRQDLDRDQLQGSCPNLPSS